MVNVGVDRRSAAEAMAAPQFDLGPNDNVAKVFQQLGHVAVSAGKCKSRKNLRPTAKAPSGSASKTKGKSKRNGSGTKPKK